MIQKISRFETQAKLRKLEDNCQTKNKPKLRTEVEKCRTMKTQKWPQALPDLGDSAHRKKPSKQEENSEAAKAKQNSKDKPSQDIQTKMTSPPTKVKTEACRKPMLKTDSSKLIVRMKTSEESKPWSHVETCETRCQIFPCEEIQVQITYTKLGKLQQANFDSSS